MIKKFNIIACVLSVLLSQSWLCQALSREYQMALPGYKFSFPRDHASHDKYKTEWWYYTGHLDSDDGHKFGYELTFFRSGMDVPDGVRDSAWAVNNIYLAHFAVTDVTAKQFFHTEKLNRAGTGVAGADQQNYHVWNENWKADLVGNEQHIRAASGNYAIDLTMIPQKAPVIHGSGGVSQKASCVGCASHYYSFTNLKTSGTVVANNKQFHIRGTSWMDHEFGSNQLTSAQVGWDWYSLQLDNNIELMLYVIRRKDGSVDQNSSGTIIYPDGHSLHISKGEYKIYRQGVWHSSESGANYPMGWRIEIPRLNTSVTIKPLMENQELVKRRASDVSYWEGACQISGTMANQPVSGQAYVEMTGYAEIFNSGI